LRLDATGQSWMAIEIDGGFHRERADEHARRAHGLRLNVLRYSNNQVEGSDFAYRVVREIRTTRSAGDAKAILASEKF
jgi:very-short-patch-repair endonuclease